MKTPPSSTSSRPASMRRAVVLPEPDGPTSTISSASAISRSRASTAGVSVPGYVLVARKKRISATVSPAYRLEPGLEALDGGRQLTAQTSLSVPVRAELVEAEQRRPHDRGRG